MERYFIDNLDTAISREWIKAYHHPLIRAASGLVSDEESLARWEDPEKGVFTAAEFVPVLEKEKLSYKLDLYMVERVLKKLKGQAEHGLHIVPESVNISRADFDSCDMVKEITQRIDASGLSRDILIVELNEKDVGSDVDYMKTQVERFNKEGIKVWLDNYGGGHSSLLILLKIHFDLLKISRELVAQIGKNEAAQIVLTEYIKTAIALGIDTSAKGVETREQAMFLKEVGCTKLQGFHYIKPVSLATIIERNEKGIQIGFENPAEFEYYEKLGRVNLYDLSFSRADSDSLDKYFDTMPMVIFTLDDNKATFIRCNKSYREFLDKYFPDTKRWRFFNYDSIRPGVGYYSYNAVKQCAADGKRAIIDDRMSDGRTIQLFARRIAVNPVTGASAVAIAVLSVSEAATKNELTYNYIARALSEDYLYLFFVDLDTEEYTEYAANGVNRDITFERHGDHFFEYEKTGIELEIPDDELSQLKVNFTRKNVEKGLAENGTFSLLTKIYLDRQLVNVSIKAVKVRGEGNHIIVGISNVDAQIKSREVLEKAKEEKVIYSRVGALTGDYIYIYTVDPETFHYKKYNPSSIVSDLGISDEGDDFFGSIISNAPNGIYHEDLHDFLSAFTKEGVLEEIEKKGIFENRHRLNIGGTPRYVLMRATILQEEDGKKLIMGILDIDERVRREQEYEANLFDAQHRASYDELTGVKNKNAYASVEKKMDGLIADEVHFDFAIALFDINDLKLVNDTYGHQAGDAFIKKGCDYICRLFKHSPVYRIGGDEFVVVAQGYDYLNIDSIMDKLRKHNIKNRLKGEIVIAGGMSRFDDDPTVAAVFKRADEEMYKNKAELKK